MAPSTALLYWNKWKVDFIGNIKNKTTISSSGDGSYRLDRQKQPTTPCESFSPTLKRCYYSQLFIVGGCSTQVVAPQLFAVQFLDLFCSPLHSRCEQQLLTLATTCGQLAQLSYSNQLFLFVCTHQKDCTIHWKRYPRKRTPHITENLDSIFMNQTLVFPGPWDVEGN